MRSRPGLTLRKLREFRRNARLTRAQLEELKLSKFRALMRHAAAHAPYYAQLVAERRLDINRCVPSDFPPLTKSILMANFDRIVTDQRITKQAIADFLTRSKDPTELFLDKFRVIHTSGTSGEVGYFVFSPEDWARGTARALPRRQEARPQRTRRRFGRMKLAYYAAVGGHFGGVTLVTAATRGLARLFVQCRLYEVNDPLPATLTSLNEFQPDVLAGYTGALTILAERQRAGALRIAPIAIGTAGEALSATDKRTLEEAFGCVAHNSYGSSEHLIQGFALPGGTSMLLFDDDLIYEPFEDHTLVSNLFNYTLPLVRYRMADILRPIAAANAQHGPYLEIESLVGRTEMMPKFLNQDGIEDFISPHTVNEIFVAGVSRFQMQLTGPTAFRFVVCLDPSLDVGQRAESVRGVERRLSEILAQKRMSNVQFTVRTVDEIALNPRSRKFQLIIKDDATQ